MKRIGCLFDSVVSFANLCEAARRAAQGKKNRPATARFLFHLEKEVLVLQEELIHGSYRPRPYRTFFIREPKLRKICAADFRDRVVHHAVCRYLEPVIEQSLIHDTYACRKGKGGLAAIYRSQYFARRCPYFLKGDIRHYYENVDLAIMKCLLRRRLKDIRLLDLLDHILDHPFTESRPGKGLPIGNLTSQHMANLYLSRLDHFVQERLGLKGYLRYMDDFLLFAEDKNSLLHSLQKIRDFLADSLHLELKEKVSAPTPVSEGVPFLGFRIFPHLIRMESDKWHGFCREIRKKERDWQNGRIMESELAVSVSASIGHIVHADTLSARKSFFGHNLSQPGKRPIQARTG